MTALEAKEKTLYFWRYLARHPSINCKSGLPHRMFQQLHRYSNDCPLCEYRKSINDWQSSIIPSCEGCPLVSCTTNSVYSRWQFADTGEERQQAAQEIIRLVEAWEV